MYVDSNNGNGVINNLLKFGDLHVQWLCCKQPNNKIPTHIIKVNIRSY